jgi:hypothetical protein
MFSPKSMSNLGRLMVVVKFWLIAQVTIAALQRQNTENSKQIFLETELRGLFPNFHIHVSVSDLCFPTILFCSKKICVAGNI